MATSPFWRRTLAEITEEPAAHREWTELIQRRLERSTAGRTCRRNGTAGSGLQRQRLEASVERLDTALARRRIAYPGREPEHVADGAPLAMDPLNPLAPPADEHPEGAVDVRGRPERLRQRDGVLHRSS